MIPAVMIISVAIPVLLALATLKANRKAKPALVKVVAQRRR